MGVRRDRSGRAGLWGAAVTAGLVGVVLPAHAEGSMPQFDFRNPLLVAQIVWGTIIFVGMYVSFTRIGLPHVAAVLTAREQTIGGDLEQARIAKEKADRAVAELNEARRVAYAEAQTALSAATQKAKDVAAVKAEEVNAKLDQQLADSEKQIAAARADAMSALREAAADTAEMLVGRLAGRPADAHAVRVAVADALAARGLAA
jgi:F-type H+-transporting ATPase subunit b